MENNAKKSTETTANALTGKQIEVLIKSFTDLYIKDYGEDYCIKLLTECYFNYAELIISSEDSCNKFYVNTLGLLRCVFELFQDVHTAKD